jgi:alpha/beta superfamily hydrolase
MSYEEFPVFIPMGEEHLCAVVCAPESGGADIGVVLLTGSNYTRTHRNRMWVKAAREFADAGVPSIRLDYHGVGDSTGSGAVFNLEAPFYEDALAAADFLIRSTGVSKLAFVATCFGGRTAMGAAARHPKATIATVFPAHLMVEREARGLPLRTKIRNRIRRWGWGKRMFARPAVRRMRNAAAARRTGPARIVSPRFRRDFEEFLRRGHVHFVYGDQSDSLNDVRTLLADVEKTLPDEAKSRIHLKVLSDCAPESFRSLEIQDIAIEHAVSSVLEGANLRTLSPAAGAPGA